jgi:hypothetical protein
MWDLLGDQAVDVPTASVMYGSLLQLYFAERYYDMSSIADTVKATALADAKAHASEGSEMQRMIGLAILLNVSPVEAIDVAKGVLGDGKASSQLHADALQIQLLASRRPEATKVAVDEVLSGEYQVKHVALQYLASGPNAMQQLREEVFLRYVQMSDPSDYIRQGTPVILQAPPGLKAEHLKPILKSGDHEAAAYAGYLLALLGERQGLDRLVAYWNENPKDQSVKRLVYRAVAAMNDDELTPIVERVYNTYDKDDYSLREFYWTIRVMSGEKVLKLRKRIRDEVGMDHLR